MNWLTALSPPVLSAATRLAIVKWKKCEEVDSGPHCPGWLSREEREAEHQLSLHRALSLYVSFSLYFFSS